jgi:hypothetical protein
MAVEQAEIPSTEHITAQTMKRKGGYAGLY